MKTNFINLTPHTINLYEDNKKNLIDSFPSNGMARVKTQEPIIYNIDGIPVVKTEYLEVEGLPQPKENIIYIVSILVLQALNGTRTDCVAPNTSPSACVRDEKGNILGVTSFTVI